MENVYIALGSNILPRYTYLQKATLLLSKNNQITIEKQSSIYETEPVGYMEQSNFLNMVVEISTSLKPTELLDYCQKIEIELGRKREIKWGPRTIDLDILLYNQETIQTEQLTVPHPRMHERAFVLVPLCDLNPEFKIPLVNKAVIDVLDEVPQQQIEGVVKWVRSNGEDE
ncbi:2-amino-4-hydroxy-6-hydroxymethyldihydropteridine diphosphokinase [Aquibacillus salsiterrae]|uniref:2-amino-4-hydroxy-6-hydroxymethyldihydropteridine diphosphokinase n=1 Tax=Aquibacillus salsiterrae TaxID=2950439 RepID=A0A9X3WDK0_9BACI|nr:2-amino-4-hydroxy-6-hydroxymethyldihydropteridine diphosphokinase [Aquibacillus salsiterrae]MDC3417905.1 2-amino-4-hydroxy-6-hydroxymethyldihydropteridine diphosphokinase [Aquibacillus salsiterrae]